MSATDRSRVAGVLLPGRPSVAPRSSSVRDRNEDSGSKGHCHGLLVRLLLVSPHHQDTHCIVLALARREPRRDRRSSDPRTGPRPGRPHHAAPWGDDGDRGVADRSRGRASLTVDRQREVNRTSRRTRPASPVGDGVALTHHAAARCDRCGSPRPATTPRCAVPVGKRMPGHCRLIRPGVRPGVPDVVGGKTGRS